MANTIQRIADRLGAQIVGQVPDVGGGAFGAARLAQIVARMQTRAGSEDATDWSAHPEVPMNPTTLHKLTRLAEQASTPEHRVSPMQIAAQILEEAVAAMPE